MANVTELFTLFNISNITDDTEMIPDLFRTAVLGTIASFLMVSILLGNILVILAVTTTPTLQNSTNWLIVNLACADLCLGLFAVPLSTLVFVYDFRWPFGYTTCDVWLVTDIFLITASILTSGAIGIDRYISLTRPLHYNTIVTGKRLVVVILAVWMMSFGFAIPVLQRPRENPNLCKVSNDVGFVMYSVIGCFYVPTTIVVIIYIKIYRIATTKQGSRIAQYMCKELNEQCQTSEVNVWEENSFTLKQYMNSLPVGKSVSRGPRCSIYHVSKQSDITVKNSMKSQRVSKFENKALRTIGIIIGVFIVCWLPFSFLFPIDVICRQCNVPKIAIDITFWLGYFNSLMNPIIYAFSSKRYKEAFLRLLRCRGKR